MFVTGKMPGTIETRDFSDLEEARALEKIRISLQNGHTREACELALASLPFHQLLPIFIDEIVPALKKSAPFTDIPLYNLVLILQSMGQEALASQLLLELGVDTHKLFTNLQLAEMLQDIPPTLTDLDSFLYETTNVHFPQILYNSNVPLWFRTMILSQISRGDGRYFATTLHRFGHHFQSYDAMKILFQTNPSAYSVLSTYLLSGEVNEALVSTVCGFVDALSTAKQAHNFWNRIKKHPLASDAKIAQHMLRKATSLKASYTITNIVRSSCDLQPPALLSKALLAVAWSQKSPQENSDDALTTAWDVQYEQVSRFVDSLTPGVADDVLRKSVASLYAASDGQVAGRILWSILLGIDKSNLAKQHPLSPEVGRQLARALLQRPLLEQIRFMTLDSVNTAEISQLLKSHIAKTIQYRRANKLPAVSLENDSNVKLMLAGMIVMTEKASPALEKTDNVHLIRLVRDLFESWNPQVAADLVENLNLRHKPSPEVAMATMGLLLRHGNVALTVQLMREIGPDNLEPTQLNKLLVKVGQELPIVIVPLVSWLIRTRKAFVPPSVIRRLIISLNRTAQLTYSQRFTRTTRLLSILRGLGVGPGPVAAASMVDAMIKAAAESGRGSRRRLQWALDICQREGVPEFRVKQWLSKVVEMRSTGRGYWAK